VPGVQHPCAIRPKLPDVRIPCAIGLEQTDLAARGCPKVPGVQSARQRQRTGNSASCPWHVVQRFGLLRGAAWTLYGLAAVQKCPVCRALANGNARATLRAARGTWCTRL